MSESVAAETPGAEPIIADAPSPTTQRQRPRLDASALLGGTTRRGKSIFGQVIGTLTRAKREDKERGASDAAKRRTLIESRLATKLALEASASRRKEEAKRLKGDALRKEEELGVKASVFSLRQKHLTVLAGLLTTAEAGKDGSDGKVLPPLTGPARPAFRSIQVPPIYYLPKVLLPEQAAVIERKRREVKEALEEEWTAWEEEKMKGVEEIREMRRKAVAAQVPETQDVEMAGEKEQERERELPERELQREEKEDKTGSYTAVQMDIDTTREKEKEVAPTDVADEDAVEY